VRRELEAKRKKLGLSELRYLELIAREMGGRLLPT
jgi:hypothetical protein